MKYYTEFAKAFEVFKLEYLLGNTDSIGNSGENFITNIEGGLSACKIFQIDNSAKKLLLLTDIPKINSHLKLPFEKVFLDVELTKEDIELGLGYELMDKKGIYKVGIRQVGIYLTRGDLINDAGQAMGNSLRITTMTMSDNGVWFDTFNEDLDIRQDAPTDIKIIRRSSYLDTVMGKKGLMKRLIYNFVVAFLNMLNNPDVEIVEIERDEAKNLKRISKGKLPIPSMQAIRITGKLKIYIDDLKKNGYIDTSYYTHSFWVRGHFRTLRHPKYKENVGKRVWVIPFLRGKGLLIEKEYYLQRE